MIWKCTSCTIPTCRHRRGRSDGTVKRRSRRRRVKIVSNWRTPCKMKKHRKLLKNWQKKEMQRKIYVKSEVERKNPMARSLMMNQSTQRYFFKKSEKTIFLNKKSKLSEIEHKRNVENERRNTWNRQRKRAKFTPWLMAVLGWGWFLISIWMEFWILSSIESTPVLRSTEPGEINIFKIIFYFGIKFNLLKSLKMMPTFIGQFKNHFWIFNWIIIDSLKKSTENYLLIGKNDL